MMLLFVDQNLSDDDDTTGFKGKHVAGFLICTNAGLAPLAALVTLLGETDRGRNIVRHVVSKRSKATSIHLPTSSALPSPTSSSAGTIVTEPEEPPHTP